MPTRGYRKGVSDGKAPLPRQIYTRLTVAEYEALAAEADDRSMTVSKMIRAILAAHIAKRPADLPHPRGLTSAAIRELDRLGNNLNQIAHIANMMRLHLVAAEARACIAAAHTAIRRLVA